MAQGKIIAAQKQSNGRITLEVTDQDVFLEEGDRFKIFVTEDEVILRKVSSRKHDTMERFFLDKEANT